MQGKNFHWGQNDCLTFTNNAFHAMYGKGWADDWLNRYMKDGKPMRKKQLQQEYGFSSFIEAVDAKLHQISYIPPLGALVLTKQARKWIIGGAMGICTGTKAVFLSNKGMLYLPLDAIDKAWIKQ